MCQGHSTCCDYAKLPVPRVQLASNRTVDHAKCDLQAVAPALCHWIQALKASGPDCKPAGPDLGRFIYLIPCVTGLGNAQMISSLICTLTVYLDTQEKWKEFGSAQHGLLPFLTHVVESVRSAALAPWAEGEQPVMHCVQQHFEFLSAASRFC